MEDVERRRPRSPRRDGGDDARRAAYDRQPYERTDDGGRGRDVDGGEDGRGDDDGASKRDDEYAMSCRQCALRAVERHKRTELRPSDQLFVLFALHYDDRRAQHTSVILASKLRLEWIHPATLLSSQQFTKADIEDLQGVEKELMEAAATSFGVASARSTSDSLTSFWAKCLKYTEALEAVRDAEDDAATASQRRVGTGPAAQFAADELEDVVLSCLSRVDNMAAAVVELQALARCEDPGIDRAFYRGAALMAEVLCARRLLEGFDAAFRNPDPPPEPVAAPGADPDSEMTEQDSLATMEALRDTLEQDQQLFSDEIPTWGRDHQPAWAQRPGAPTPIKPLRYAKAHTGFRWNRYNKTHFNSHTNPPPRAVFGYEFTLLYPDLLSDVPPKFEVVPTEQGWEDTHCIIVFKAGPPYVDVAYKIVNKKFGRVKASFEPSGRYKLYFRFGGTSYRR